jgi:hypothetical protein
LYQKEEIVRSNTLQKRLVTLIGTFFLCVVVLLGLASWTCADENMSVICYKGSSRIGTVTVFDGRAAAATCNTVLVDCRGSCIGCFRDFDYVDDVCVDVHGKVFLR